MTERVLVLHYSINHFESIISSTNILYESPLDQIPAIVDREFKN